MNGRKAKAIRKAVRDREPDKALHKPIGRVIKKLCQTATKNQK